MDMLPYCGPAPAPAALAGSWNADPLLLLSLALLALPVLASPHRLAFGLGWLSLVLAFVSPLCALTVALFSARALHHLLLIGLAAPLLACGLPRPAPRRLPRGLSLGALLIALIAWHIPSVYSAIWQSHLLYWLMQAAVLIPAILFWSRCLTPREPQERMTSLALIALLAGVMGLIGAVLTFAPGALYAEHAAAPFEYGLLPGEDQQLAGLLMWVPGFVPLAAIAGLLLQRAWAESAAAARREGSR